MRCTTPCHVRPNPAAAPIYCAGLNEYLSDYRTHEPSNNSATASLDHGADPVAVQHPDARALAVPARRARVVDHARHRLRHHRHRPRRQAGESVRPDSRGGAASQFVAAIARLAGANTVLDGGLVHTGGLAGLAEACAAPSPGAEDPLLPHRNLRDFSSRRWSCRRGPTRDVAESTWSPSRSCTCRGSIAGPHAPAPAWRSQERFDREYTFLSTGRDPPRWHPDLVAPRSAETCSGHSLPVERSEAVAAAGAQSPESYRSPHFGITRVRRARDWQPHSSTAPDGTAVPGSNTKARPSPRQTGGTLRAHRAGRVMTHVTVGRQAWSTTSAGWARAGAQPHPCRGAPRAVSSRRPEPAMRPIPTSDARRSGVDVDGYVPAHDPGTREGRASFDINADVGRMRTPRHPRRARLSYAAAMRYYRLSTPKSGNPQPYSNEEGCGPIVTSAQVRGPDSASCTRASFVTD